MSNQPRGADIVMRSLAQHGAGPIFTLSGNHIMSLFDAAIGTGLDLVHVRHEAAAVHMADAWGRLTGKPGIAMVTGGPGHANAAAALFTALGEESPMVLLSGHAATHELGRGGFQELRQAEMAAPAAKASWTARSTETLAEDVSRALTLAAEGRPGPVHLSLPSDLLDAPAGHATEARYQATPLALPDAAAATILALLRTARQPLLIAGPALANRAGRALLARIEAALDLPTAIMESPRGLADATLGAFADVAAAADCVLLLGKALDFTLKFGAPPAFRPDCRWIAIEPDAEILSRAMLERGANLVFGCIADTVAAGAALIAAASPTDGPGPWRQLARAAMDHRPAAWATLRGTSPGRLHPAQLFRRLAPMIAADAETVLICDGGEFAQWGQAMLEAPRRLINGVAGSIGASIPFALAARMAAPQAPVIAVLGDGTFGFHMAEFETAVRRNLPFIAIVGNDARWNAEYNIQLRDYGAARAHGCELAPTRYDQVVAALGGYGELIEEEQQIDAAVARAAASGLPACLNVMIESTPAPALRRPLG
ncbi:MAG: thiamine pyrophosphate-binding protein [Rhodospirillales bacterium]|nr:thiamine pyrophosphate-binding protein [Rhodospirillales bacterium]